MASFNLTQTKIFGNLKQSELSFIGNFLVDKKYQLNDIIFSKNNIRKRLIIITKGNVILKTEIKEEIVALFKTGDSLGEMALVEKNGRHQYNLKVISEKLKVLELATHNWQTIIKKEPLLAAKIYQNISSILQNRLTHTNNKLVTLFATGKIIGTLNNLEQIADSILKIILKIIPSEKALFLTYNANSQKINVIRNLGYSNIKKRYIFKLSDDSLLPIIMKDKNSLIFNEDNWPNYSAGLSYKCSRIIITPIHVKEKTLGFIILGNKSNGNNFSLNNKILLEAIASQTAPAIQNISLEKFQAAEKDLKRVYIDPFYTT